MDDARGKVSIGRISIGSVTATVSGVVDCVKEEKGKGKCVCLDIVIKKINNKENNKNGKKIKRKE